MKKDVVGFIYIDAERLPSAMPSRKAPTLLILSVSGWEK